MITIKCTHPGCVETCEINNHFHNIEAVDEQPLDDPTLGFRMAFTVVLPKGWEVMSRILQPSKILCPIHAARALEIAQDLYLDSDEPLRARFAAGEDLQAQEWRELHYDLMREHADLGCECGPPWLCEIRELAKYAWDHYTGLRFG